MRHNLAAATILFLALACRSTDSDMSVDVRAIHRHLEVSHQSLLDLAAILEIDDSELAVKIVEIAEIVDSVDVVFEDYIAGEPGSEVSLREAIDIALRASEPLLEIVVDDPERQKRIRTIVAISRFTLAHLAFYLPEDVRPSEQPEDLLP